MTLEPYQTRAVSAALQHLAKHRGGVLVAPAGSGKTWICAAVIAGRPQDRVLCLAPTQETRLQMEAACVKFGVSERVTCVCFKSNPDPTGYSLIIIDEAHSAWAHSIRRILQRADPSCKFLGVTATPRRPDAAEDIQEVIGPIFHTVPRAEVEATGRVVSAGVKWYDVPGSIVDEVRHAANRKIRSWMNDEQCNRILYACAKEIGICGHVWRNAKAAELARVAMDRGRSVLVLVNTIEQGKGIAAAIGEGAVVVHSGMTKRKDTIQAIKDGSILCGVATSLADVGMDVPILSALVMACGGRAEGRTEQRVGRIMRAHDGKPAPVCCDFTDSHHYFLSAQAKKRGFVYRKLGLATL
jgi:superfamily II DNA or RNA helicase